MFLTSPRIRLAAVAGCAAVLFGLAALLLPHSPGAIRAAVSGFGWIAPLVFVALWTVLTPAMFSGTILAIAAGLLFGPVLGTGLGVAGATLGGLLSFAIARRCGADALEQVGSVRVKRVRERVSARPFRAVLVLRLMPGMPATWLNYAAGLARIPYRSFAAASAVGAAPRVLIYAGVGGSVAAPNPALRILSISLFGVLAVAGAVVAVRERRTLWPVRVD